MWEAAHGAADDVDGAAMVGRPHAAPPGDKLSILRDADLVADDDSTVRRLAPQLFD